MSRIGRGMPRARSYDEFKQIIDDALYEISEIRASYDFDGEYMNDSMQIAEAIEGPLKNIKQSLVDGSYEHSSEGFPFMKNLHGIPGDILPIKALLSRINETHIKGLEEDS